MVVILSSILPFFLFVLEQQQQLQQYYCKSTLVKMLLGMDSPDSGLITIGQTVKMVGVGQERMKELNSDSTAFEEITGGVDEIELGSQKVASRAYVSWFGFKGAQQQALVRNLSGGERNRVQLAKLLKLGANVVILDEVSCCGVLLYGMDIER